MENVMKNLENLCLTIKFTTMRDHNYSPAPSEAKVGKRAEVFFKLKNGKLQPMAA
jgi:hypothetical protein